MNTLTLSAFLLVALASIVSGVVHQFHVKQHKGSLGHQHGLLKHILQKHSTPFHPRNLAGMKAAASGSPAVSLKEIEYIALAGNITIGTPTQNLYVEFDLFWSSDLVVIGSNASLNGVEATLPAKQTFNETASSTFVDQAKKTWSELGDAHRGADIVKVGTVSSNVSLKIVDEINWCAKVYPIDGILGLSSGNSSSDVLARLVGQLEQPLVTLWSNQTASGNGTAQVTLGAVDTQNCQSDWAYYPRYSEPSHSSASFTKSLNGLAFAVNNTPVYISGYPVALSVSASIYTALVNNTGIVWNATLLNGFFTTNCNLADAATLTVEIENGSQPLVITPKDYVRYLPSLDICYLDVWTHGTGEMILLGNQFLDNHCYSFNVKTNRVGLATPVAAV